MNYSNDCHLLNDDYDAMINAAGIDWLAKMLTNDGYVYLHRRDIVDLCNSLLMGGEMAR